MIRISIRKSPAWIVLAACVYFSAAGRAFIPHLGIEADEALFVGGIYRPALAFYTVQIAHRTFPVMLMSYIGTLKSALYAVVFHWWRPNASSTRTPMVLAGVATIWLFFLLLRRISGTAAALAGCLLLAVDPTFLLTNTFDWGPTALQHLLLVSGVLLLFRYYETRGISALGWGCFLLGLGMWDKALFIWPLSALAVAALAVFPRVVWRLATPRAVIVAALWFGLGAAPLIVYNIDQPWATFRGNVAWSTKDLASKLSFAAGTLGGSYLHDFMIRDDEGGGKAIEPHTALARASEKLSRAFGQPRRSLVLPAFYLSLLLAPLVCWKRRRGARTILFALIFLAVAWFEMAINPNTGGSVHHVVLLWPFPQLVVAVAFGELAQQYRRAGRAALAVMLALVIPSSLLATNEYYRLMLRNGGSVVWSDAIYPLATFLAQAPAGHVMVLDWGFFDNLRLLDRDQLPLATTDPLEKPVLDRQDEETVRGWVGASDSVFVGHTPGNEIVPKVEARLNAIAQAAGFERATLSQIYDRNGRAIFEVFRFVPAEKNGRR